MNGHVRHPLASRNPLFGYLGRKTWFGFFSAIVVLPVMCVPLLAQTDNASPAPQPTFGQYLAEHQDDLAPFFRANAEDFFRLGLPLAMGMLGWVALATMLVGWIVDVLMGRGFAFFFAPAYAEIKRAFIYATGRLFLSSVYTVLLGIAIVFSLKMSHLVVVMLVAVGLLVLVAFAAQIVWILYLYRPPFPISLAFYLAIVIVHSLVAFLIAKPLLGAHASTVTTDFVDRVITSRLRAEVEATQKSLAAASADRESVKAKVDDLHNRITQNEAEQMRLRNEIEAKKNSDIYIFSRIVQAHARGAWADARDELGAFINRFPNSNLNAQARAQQAEIADEIAAAETRKKQEEADAAKAAAEARTDLLARAATGNVTLSEIRQVLIGKSRVEVGDLLGLPTQTGPNSWSYAQAMIVNPLTNEHHGLTVYFDQGHVQGVDYNFNGGPH